MLQGPEARRRFSRWVVWLVFALILAGNIALRWRLRLCPLERDEGEYAYIGELILQGVAPYGIVGNHKFPGSYLAYAAIMKLFGETAAGIHIGFLVVSLANTILIFLLGRRLWGDVAAVSGAAAWAITSISAHVFGNAGHLAHFVVLFFLAGALCLWRGAKTTNKWTLLTAGLCFGLAILFRQTSVVYLAFAVAWLWFTGKRSWRAGAVCLLGSLIPLAAVALWLAAAGVLPQFWRWTFVQAAAYGSQVSLLEGAGQFLKATPPVIGWNFLVWSGAAAGIAATFHFGQRQSWFVLGLLASGFLALLPGFYFREHYYLQLLPAVALLFGAAIEKLSHFGSAGKATAVFATIIAVFCPLFAERSYFLPGSPTVLARYIYGGNPFPEAVEVARYIRENSEPGDEIGILGSEPEIFFEARRPCATSLLYTYPLMEHHQFAREMQETMARELEKKNPKFVIYVNAPTSWLQRADSETLIFDWARKFLSEGYYLDGMAEILGGDSRFVWGADAAGYRPRSPYTVDVYRRNDSRVER